MEGRKWKGRGGSTLGQVTRARAPQIHLMPPPPQIQKLADRSDVISEVPKCSKIQIFRGAPPELLADGEGEGVRCLPPKNPICAFGPPFYGSQGLTKYNT